MLDVEYSRAIKHCHAPHLEIDVLLRCHGAELPVRLMLVLFMGAVSKLFDRFFNYKDIAVVQVPQFPVVTHNKQTDDRGLFCGVSTRESERESGSVSPSGVPQLFTNHPTHKETQRGSTHAFKPA